MKKNTNSKGFTILEVVLMMVVVGVLCGVVGYVVSANKEKTPAKTSSTSSQNSATSPTSATTVKSDKEQIISLIAGTCGGDTTQIRADLDKSGKLNIDGSWAGVGVSCDSEGGGYYAYLKKSNDKWDYFLKTQDTPGCSKFDNSGVSAKVLPECYDEATTSMRAPK